MTLDVVRLIATRILENATLAQIEAETRLSAEQVRVVLFALDREALRVFRANQCVAWMTAAVGRLRRVRRGDRSLAFVTAVPSGMVLWFAFGDDDMDVVDALRHRSDPAVYRSLESADWRALGVGLVSLSTARTLQLAATTADAAGASEDEMLAILRIHAVNLNFFALGVETKPLAKTAASRLMRGAARASFPTFDRFVDAAGAALPPPEVAAETPVAIRAAAEIPPTPTPCPHPGAVVREQLALRGWSMYRLANATALDRSTLRRLCLGRVRMTPRTAAALAPVLDVPERVWLDLQARHDARALRKNA